MSSSSLAIRRAALRWPRNGDGVGEFALVDRGRSLKVRSLSGVDFDDQRSVRAQKTAANGYRLGNHRKKIVADRAAVGSGEQKDALFTVGITDKKRGRDATANAADSAIAMNLALSWIHDAEKALAVDDFAGELDFAQVDARPRGCATLSSALDRLRKDLEHSILFARNERAIYLHAGPIESVQRFCRAVFAREYQ